MNTRSHPSAALLSDYAGGSLAHAPSLVVSAHVETCVACQADLGELESEKGEELEAQSLVPMSADALSRVLARLDEPSFPTEPYISRRLGDVTLPDAVWRAGVGARRWMSGDLWAAPVKTSSEDDWRAFLLRIPAGTIIPRHGHQGGELVAVLSGGYHDDRAYSAGDFTANSADRHHRLMVEAGGPCACLIAVQGRLKWRGWARVIAPLLGI